MRNHPAVLSLLVLLFTAPSLALPQAGLPLDLIELPPGFTISLYASDLPDARSLALGDNGTVFVGSRHEGSVYALTDADGDGVSDQTSTIATRLDSPNGVAFHDGSLYVAEVSRIIRFDDIENRLDNPPAPVLVSDIFPDDQQHGWKYLRLGPDGKLYVPVGVACNVCAESPDYGLIMRMNVDGSEAEVYARGLRNSVGFDWHPETAELWFTDNGRDWVSADTPPDELNHAPEAGLHFGFPYCHGGTLPDTDFNAGRDCGEFVASALNLGAHVAPLGLRFYTGALFPDEYYQQMLIAEHGSWNSPTLVGYRIMLVHFEGNSPVSYEPFAEGWLQGDAFWGRPVDLLEMPDGALLVSDDYAGVVYRITYSAPSP